MMKPITPAGEWDRSRAPPPPPPRLPSSLRGYKSGRREHPTAPDWGSLPKKMPLFLFLVAFLLPPGAGAGDIIGGREARPHSRPYMAYLQIRSPNGGSSACGGFLVREDFVLTAAHCWGSRITVTLGAHDVGRRERVQQRTTARRAIQHPGYNPRTIANDIMLLQLTNRIRRTRQVRPVPLPQAQATVRPGTTCTVAGWGRLGLNRRTNKLHEVQLTVQNNSRCSRRFNFFNGQTQICVGSPRARKSAFSGDSGGPLVCNGVAQGIVSYGDTSGTPPEVFTRISAFMPWVRRTMRRFQQQCQP